MWDIGRSLRLLESFSGVLPNPPSEPFACYVWLLMNSRTVPARAERAFAALKRLRALTPDAVRRVAPAGLERAVSMAGPYLQARLEAIHRGARQFRRDARLTAGLRGPLREARALLKPLPIREACDVRVMLLFAGGHLVFPVDANVHRVISRLSASRDDPAAHRVTPMSLRRRVIEGLEHSVDAYRRAYLYLSHHGATCCVEEPHCGVCPLSEACGEGRRRLGLNGTVAEGPRRRMRASTR